MSAAHQLERLEYPAVLRPLLSRFTDFLPNGVEYDKDTGQISINAPLTQELQVALAFFRLYSESSDVLDNLNVVIRDMFALAISPPPTAQEGDLRYVLLTRLFFYEITRLRDIVPRFLKLLETANVVEKSERKTIAKDAQRLFDEHYLIRNVFIHGHTFPQSKGEQDLSLLASLEHAGYEPAIARKDARYESIAYPETLKKLAVDRSDALYEIGSNTFQLIQSIVTVLALYIAHHHLEMDISQSASE